MTTDRSIIPTRVAPINRVGPDRAAHRAEGLGPPRRASHRRRERERGRALRRGVRGPGRTNVPQFGFVGRWSVLAGFPLAQCRKAPVLSLSGETVCKPLMLLLLGILRAWHRVAQSGNISRGLALFLFASLGPQRGLAGAPSKRTQMPGNARRSAATGHDRIR
jgi:hypothetical protein